MGATPHLLLILAILASTGLCCTKVAASPDAPPQDKAEFLQTFCLDCHSGEKAKAKFNLDQVVDHLQDNATTDADRSILRKALRRITDGEMPPTTSDPQPSIAQRTAAMQSLHTSLLVDRSQITVTSGPPRRLNRAEYSNTIRDLFGIDVAPFGALPPDDVGAGFDNVGSVLSLAPTSLERLLDVAEMISSQAVLDADAIAAVKIVIPGESMRITNGKGTKHAKGALIWSNGEAFAKMKLPRAGRYAITSQVAGQQAGPEPVRMSLIVDKKPLEEFTVTETFSDPGQRRTEANLKAGSQTIAISFNNDFFEKAGPDKPKSDRNSLVCQITIEGPIEPYITPEWRQSLDALIGAQTGDVRRNASANWLVERMLRRPATAGDRKLLSSVCKQLGPSTTFDAQLRTMITALLVHPEFLFRIEKEPSGQKNVREISPSELATRLSYFLWASCPDESLARAAASGELKNERGRSAVVARMLADPKSFSLAERFATQWLAIDGLDQNTPDPKQFPGIDAQLLSAMRQESVLLFDSVLRERLPVQTLIDADYTFVDARLAQHYGMTAPTSNEMIRVPIDAARGGGVLAHASVLTATSNPTRTSPVKRGKWVLDSLLDAPPPPPPPGTAQIPDRVADRGGKSIRELLEIHRADPNCASCHIRMDAIGFAFEAYDPVGRLRNQVDGLPVETRGELPGGVVLVGLDGVRSSLRQNPAFIRSLVKHLLTYAIGCEPTENTEVEIDFLCKNLSLSPTLFDIVNAITESPSFRMRVAH